MTEISTRMIDFPSNGQRTPGFLAQPLQGAAPGLVVIQEWWGLVPHIQDVCQRFARQGFVALAPDLYHGKSASEPDEARKLVMALDKDHAVTEIMAALHHLKTLDGVYPKKVGVVGWCMGGMLTIATAAASPDVDATVVFYGSPGDLGLVSNIQAPLLGLYAEHDHGISVDAVNAFEQTLRRHNIPHDIHVYPGTQHAFFNDTRPHIYDDAAAQDAWERTLTWFRQYLA